MQQAHIETVDPTMVGAATVLKGVGVVGGVQAMVGVLEMQRVQALWAVLMVVVVAGVVAGRVVPVLAVEAKEELEIVEMGKQTVDRQTV